MTDSRSLSPEADATPRPVGALARRSSGLLACLWLLIAAPAGLFAQAAPTQETPADSARPRQARRVQTRPSGMRVDVPLDKIIIDDGDTVVIDWDGDRETVRILGIDTPEIQHLPHNIPYDQPFGREATGFASGAFAVAGKVEILRSDTLDPYGRTLGYLFVDGKNYSVLVVQAHLAIETVSHYGDNGFPDEAAAVLAAAKAAGPVPFEPPFQYRNRMREVSDWMREHDLWPIEESGGR